MLAREVQCSWDLVYLQTPPGGRDGVRWVGYHGSLEGNRVSGCVPALLCIPLLMDEYSEVRVQTTWAVLWLRSDRGPRRSSFFGVNERTEAEMGRDWRKKILLLLGPSTPLCKDLNARPPRLGLPPSYPAATHRGTAPEGVPALQHHQVKALDCASQEAPKEQV